jgi:hypothetical protein
VRTTDGAVADGVTRRGGSLLGFSVPLKRLQITTVERLTLQILDSKRHDWFPPFSVGIVRILTPDRGPYTRSVE